MLPSNKTEEERHGMIFRLFRDILLNNLIVDTNGPQDREGFRMILQHSGHAAHGGNITTSESQGYGMMMLAYMAGSEEALGLSEDEWRNGSTGLKDYFDAMLRTVIAFPSVHRPGINLFAWKLLGRFNEESEHKEAAFVRVSNGNSATDGDMDIIYALLLADRQWGGGTKFNGRSYKDIALDMLADFWQYIIHDEHYTLLLGDWAKEAEYEEMILNHATRPSDFILGHLTAYKEADPGHDWQKVIDATYGVIKDIREAEIAAGRDNGLMPDFVIRGEDRWEVPAGHVLESHTDKDYAYNSVRVPWRLGTYYMLFGDTAIGERSLYEYIIGPIDDFAQQHSGGDMEMLGPVHLNGTAFEWTDVATFAAPFLVTAAARGQNQNWVNAFYEGWTEWRDVGGNNWQPFDSGLGGYRDDYYGVYIKLLCMIAANGYWWMP
jgi:hypothetical protein